MNKITINGILRKGNARYNPGHVYWLDVTRKSGTVDTLLVLSPDAGLTEGSIRITGHMAAEYLKEFGVPVYIVPEAIEECNEDNVSEAVITGILKDNPLCRKTHGGKSITSLRIKTDKGQIPAILWGSTATDAANTFHAGDMVKVTGRLQSREYPSKKGGSRTTYELSGNNIEMYEDK